jgi:hypothetical protein
MARAVHVVEGVAVEVVKAVGRQVDGKDQKSQAADDRDL